MPHQVSAIMGQSQTHQANGAKVNDPGGYTTTMTSGGRIPG
jgi:hypothetical protein